MSEEITPEPKRGLAQAGIARGVTAGLQGEDVSARGILTAVGGVRGILETVVPALLYLATFVVTQDARTSVIAPAALAVLLVVIRLVQKQSVVTALSGAIGVAISVVTTLITGRGEDYFLPGFWINAAWALALIISVSVGWPLLGFVAGMFSNDLTGWRKNRVVRRASMIASLIWLSLFVLRLIVQVPMYLTGDVASLGVARLVMGTPLFALVVLVTWLLFRNIPKDASRVAQ